MANPIAALLIMGLLVLQTSMLAIADRQIYRTWLTPFVLLAGPYTVIALLAFIIGPVLGFVPLYTPSVVIWIAALLAFWLGGASVAVPLIRQQPRTMRRLHTSLQYEVRSRKLMFLLSWLCVLTLVVAAARIIRDMGGIAGLGTDAFTTLYGSGFTGHIFTVTQLLLVYWIGTYRRLRALDIVTILAVAGVNILYQGKGALLLPVLGGIIYRLLTGRLRLTWRSVILVAVMGYVLFNAIYMLTFSTVDPTAILNSDAYLALFYHFWTFLFAGVLGFSEVIRQGLELSAPPSLLIEPVINLVALIFHKNLLGSSVSGFDYMIIHPGYGKLTNVITMFGVMQAAVGSLGTLLSAWIMGAIYYALFVFTVRTRNCWLLVAYSFLAAVLCFGWFSYFFSLLTYIEIPVLCVILAILIKITHSQRRADVAEGDGASLEAQL